MSGSRLAELSALITAHTAVIDSSLSQRGLPSPSFQPEQPADLLSDEGIADSRQIILEATDELRALMLGPVGILTTAYVSHELGISDGKNMRSIRVMIIGLTALRPS